MTKLKRCALLLCIILFSCNFNTFALEPKLFDSNQTIPHPDLRVYSAGFPDYYSGHDEINVSLKVDYNNDVSINLSDLKLRYYFTSDSYNIDDMVISPAYYISIHDKAGMPYKLSLDKEVNITCNAMKNPTSMADSFFEISFTYDCTDFWNLEIEFSGRIPNASLNWENDYSWLPRESIYPETAWERVPCYWNDVLVWGQEPVAPSATPTPTPANTPVPPQKTPQSGLEIYTRKLPEEGYDGSDSIYVLLKLVKNNSTPINLSDIKLRYYFTSDGYDLRDMSIRTDPNGIYVFDNIGKLIALLGMGDEVDITYDFVTNPTSTVNSYLEISFNEDCPSFSEVYIDFRATIPNSSLNLKNDYSWPGSLASGESFWNYTLWDKVTCYLNDVLVWGDEPDVIIPPPTPSPTLTSVSGYLQPDHRYMETAANENFKVEIPELEISTFTNSDGFFRITANFDPENNYTVKISKSNYLYREIKDLKIDSDKQISTLSEPIEMWAGDLAIDGQQDHAINMTDIMKMIESFNTAVGDGKYNVDYDFNQDSAINMTDIMIIVKHFNATPQDYPEIV